MEDTVEESKREAEVSTEAKNKSQEAKRKSQEAKTEPQDAKRKSQLTISRAVRKFCMDDIDEIKFHHHLFLKLITVLIVPSITFLLLSGVQTIKKPKTTNPTMLPNKRSSCSKTCTLDIVESIPQSISFGDTELPESTFSAWKSLIGDTKSELLIAAYKTSLRGKHVLSAADAQLFSYEGDEIFDELLQKGSQKGVSIRIAENWPPKAKGNNADAQAFESKGVARKRNVNLLGGRMHSKLIISDRKSFYLGSANLDWRSLNQKMELGVVVKNCACLADDLVGVFNSYWRLPSNEAIDLYSIAPLHQKRAAFNMQKPLRIFYKGAPTEAYIATSPPVLNAPGRTWDLDAIIGAIDNSNEYLYIHVMDYLPMHVYSKPRRSWPVIDDAIRKAVKRGVEVKLLTAALHFPALSLPFLVSLESLNEMPGNNSIQVRIFKVPKPDCMPPLLGRARRTHNKFVVNDDTVIIGTSNFSGDYFNSTVVGAAFVARQAEDSKPFVDKMKQIFLRDWDSAYTHPVVEYTEQCLWTRTGSFCELR